jgi:branched-chain amino acid transport system ATP-binding protein
VFDGRIVGLIGPNGAGKTTAFNVFHRISGADEGEVRYAATLLNGLKPHDIAALGLVRTFPAHEHISEQQRVRKLSDRLASAGRSTALGHAAGLPREERRGAEFADRGA